MLSVFLMLVRDLHTYICYHMGHTNPVASRRGVDQTWKSRSLRFGFGLGRGGGREEGRKGEVDSSFSVSFFTVHVFL